MTNNNITPDPKDPRNLNDEAVTRRVESVEGTPNTAGASRVEKVTTERTVTRDGAGSTAVAENQGGGWWKWLLGLLALLLLGWLLWSLFSGNDNENATTGETSTTVVATETENVTETSVANENGAANGAESATEQAGNALENATEQAGNALENATEQAGNAAENAGNAVESAVSPN